MQLHFLLPLSISLCTVVTDQSFNFFYLSSFPSFLIKVAVLHTGAHQECGNTITDNRANVHIFVDVFYFISPCLRLNSYVGTT